MFGMGAQEIAIIAIILIVVVGPDDLPGMLRTIGKWVGNVQSMARDFRRQIDNMADDAGFSEERKMLDQARSFNPNKLVKDTLDPTGDIAKDLEKTSKDVNEASFAVRADTSLGLAQSKVSDSATAESEDSPQSNKAR